MPVPDVVARANRRLVNPVLGRLGGRIRPFATVHHVGRRSGRAYANPVWAFPHDGRWWIALTYGPDRDWVRNVLAAGGCTLDHQHRTFELTDPVRVDLAEAAPHLPAVIHAALRVRRADDVLVLDEVA